MIWLGCERERKRNVLEVVMVSMEDIDFYFRFCSLWGVREERVFIEGSREAVNWVRWGEFFRGG